MAIEIIPKAKRGLERPSFKNVLFYISIALLVLTLGSWLYLNYRYSKDLERLGELKQQLTKEKTREQIRLEQKVLSTKKKIRVFSDLVSSHQRPSKFLEFLEQNIHPQVVLTELNLKPLSKQIQIEGSAKGFKFLQQQLELFRKKEPVKEVRLLEIKVGKKGGLRFSITINLK